MTIQYADILIRLDLANEIIADQSVKSAGPKKLEIKLKKQQENATWMGIEKGGETKLMATAVP